MMMIIEKKKNYMCVCVCVRVSRLLARTESENRPKESAEFRWRGV
jgi:hypothetical protein